MNEAEKNYLSSVELIGEQIRQAFLEASLIKMPSAYKTINKILVIGMGGSQLPIDIISSLFADNLKVPVFQVRNYNLPAFCDSKTLIVLSSYSGTTEEVLFAGKQAKAKKFKVVALTEGGQLAKMAQKNNWPIHKFEAINNPSKQPRMGIGYIMGGFLAVLKQLSLLDLEKADLDLITTSAIKSFQKYSQGSFVSQLAKKLQNKIPLIVASEHLAGNAHLLTNQLNESSKQLANYFLLPELNHHLLEGLTFPVTNKKQLHFILLAAKNYHPRNLKRFVITEKVLKKQGFAFTTLTLDGPKISQAIDLMIMGGLLSYELSRLNKVDPNAIPWVNLFKKELGK